MSYSIIALLIVMVIIMILVYTPLLPSLDTFINKIKRILGIETDYLIEWNDYIKETNIISLEDYICKKDDKKYFVKMKFVKGIPLCTEAKFTYIKNDNLTYKITEIDESDFIKYKNFPLIKHHVYKSTIIDDYRIDDIQKLWLDNKLKYRNVVVLDRVQKSQWHNDDNGEVSFSTRGEAGGNYKLYHIKITDNSFNR